jgi:hypothetical protein
MKKRLILFGLLMVFALTPFASVSAADYSKMTNDELYALVQQEQVLGGVGDGPNISEEWTKRVIKMTPEERKKYKIWLTEKQIDAIRQQRLAPAQ